MSDINNVSLIKFPDGRSWIIKDSVARSKDKPNIEFNSPYDKDSNKAATMNDINKALGDVETLLNTI